MRFEAIAEPKQMSPQAVLVLTVGFSFFQSILVSVNCQSHFILERSISSWGEPAFVRLRRENYVLKYSLRSRAGAPVFVALPLGRRATSEWRDALAGCRET